MVKSPPYPHQQSALLPSQTNLLNSLSSISPCHIKCKNSSTSHQHAISLLFQLITIISLYVMCTQVVVGVNGQPQIWCSPVELPHTDNLYNKDNPEIIVFSQPVWWNEYYFINITTNGTFTFKLYPARPSDIPMGFYRWNDNCPQPQGSFYDYIKYGVNHVLTMDVPVVAGVQLVFMVRMLGCNYTIVGGLQGAVPEYCPSDCNYRGYCDMSTTKCACEGGWEGDACETPISKPKIPLGNWAAFYGTVIGVPVAVAAIGGGVATLLIMRRKRRMVIVRSPLLINSAMSVNNAPNNFTDDERARFLPPIE